MNGFQMKLYGPKSLSSTPISYCQPDTVQKGNQFSERTGLQLEFSLSHSHKQISCIMVCSVGHKLIFEVYMMLSVPPFFLPSPEQNVEVILTFPAKVRLSNTVKTPSTLMHHSSMVNTKLATKKNTLCMSLLQHLTQWVMIGGESRLFKAQCQCVEV